MAGILRDGFQTWIQFQANGTIFVLDHAREKTVTPPGYDAGGPIDTTSMRNTRFRTRYPKALITLTDMTLTVEYAVEALEEIFGLLGDNNLITVFYPDGSEESFYGYLDKFQPQEMREGEQPLATITIVPTNVHPTFDTEEAPIFALV